MVSSKGALRHKFMGLIDQFKPADKALISDALRFAEAAHDGQYRKLTKFQDLPDPYIVHPIRVAMIVIEELRLTDPVIICGALLHDAVEDSGGKITTSDIEKTFGRNVALMVSILTKPPADEKISRSEQLHTYHGRINQSNLQTKIVKLCDRLDNIRETVDSSDLAFQKKYLAETMSIHAPMAENVDPYLFSELVETCEKIRHSLQLNATQLPAGER
jgi:(p)ppGpp synthase/HD superfamily hydrolase